jgi:signal transduction histidine kinase
MNEEVLGKIFLPFFTTKDVSEGTGLGLPVVHGIVCSHGGSIDVRSRPGQGTRFEIRLPAAGWEHVQETGANGTRG